MPPRSARSRLRSPTTGRVFDAFVEGLREEPIVDESMCDKVDALLKSGDVINPASLKAALFPESEADGS